MSDNSENRDIQDLENSLEAKALGFRFDREKILQILAKQPELSKDFELNLFHARKLRAEYVYNTAALEGNTFSYPEVETLLSGITVGGHKLSEQQQILNQNASWLKLIELLKNNKFALNKKLILGLHIKVAFDEARTWGAFRDGQVKISGTHYLPPKAEYLPKIFDQGLEALSREVNVFLRAFLAFMFLSRNQFFWDGNKRTGRLIMNGILLNEGLPMFILEAKDRPEISKLIAQFYETGEATRILKFFIEKYFNSTLASFFVKQ